MLKQAIKMPEVSLNYDNADEKRMVRILAKMVSQKLHTKEYAEKLQAVVDDAKRVVIESVRDMRRP